ncbi:MAG: hypothetical protein K6357_06405 [Elusimicrobiota bacterium]
MKKIYFLLFTFYPPLFKQDYNFRKIEDAYVYEFYNDKILTYQKPLFLKDISNAYSDLKLFVKNSFSKDNFINLDIFQLWSH